MVINNNIKPIYNSLTEWRKAEPKAWSAAFEKNFINEICEKFGWEKPKNKVRKPKNYWTLDKIKNISKEFSSRGEWAKKDNTTYKIANQNKWLDDCCKHMESFWSKKWNLEVCKKDALKYKTKYEWEKNSGSAYSSARKNKWLNECCSHMREYFVWTKKLVLIESKKYKSRSEWLKNSSSSYASAKRNGWFDECCKNMNFYGKK